MRSGLALPVILPYFAPLVTLSVLWLGYLVSPFNKEDVAAAPGSVPFWLYLLGYCAFFGVAFQVTLGSLLNALFLRARRPGTRLILGLAGVLVPTQILSLVITASSDPASVKGVLIASVALAFTVGVWFASSAFGPDRSK